MKEYLRFMGILLIITAVTVLPLLVFVLVGWFEERQQNSWRGAVAVFASVGWGVASVWAAVRAYVEGDIR